MKRTATLRSIMLASFLFATAFVAGGRSDDIAPTVSGTTQGNVGCVILEKHMPIKGKLLLAGVIYARTEYNVLETFNYKLDKQKFTGQGEINELNQRAARDKVKLVVLPSKHTDEQMNEARKLCHQ